ncbi:MAG: transposase [Gammaproteobacteria bacterium]|nr:transposase [Gammaproteobacteria bacterium]MCP5197830.1 transposase [Gammaproteobacteria bacterium]
MRYRRSTTPGATYFFTVVTYRRRAILCEPDAMALLRDAFTTVKQRHPFRIDAVVILPDHLHCLWTLPLDDADYSTRWMLIKSHFTRRCPASLKTIRSPALRHKREQTIWQRRYWEYQIRDDQDFERHCDYIHYNPVKHGHTTRVADWPHSSFRRFVENGLYPLDWAGHPDWIDATGFGE